MSLITHNAKGEMREFWMRYRQVSRESFSNYNYFYPKTGTCQFASLLRNVKCRVRVANLVELDQIAPSRSRPIWFDYTCMSCFYGKNVRFRT